MKGQPPHTYAVPMQQLRVEAVTLRPPILGQENILNLLYNNRNVVYNNTNPRFSLNLHSSFTSGNEDLNNKDKGQNHNSIHNNLAHSHTEYNHRQRNRPSVTSYLVNNRKDQDRIRSHLLNKYHKPRHYPTVEEERTTGIGGK